MSPTLGLMAMNFFLADVAGGLGPFLASWLAQVAHWSAERIGYVTTAGAVIVVIASTPAGALVDRFCRPRVLLTFCCAAIAVGTLALLPLRGFIPVIASQSLVALGGAVGAPAVTALTLAVVGKKGFARQQGNNEAANHTGNVVAAGMVAGLNYVLGASAAIAVLAGMAVATAISLWVIPADALDSDRACGRNQCAEGEIAPDGTLRALIRD